MAKQEKKNAALAAVQYVRSGMTLGLGTGSTAYFAVEAIGQAWQNGTLSDIRAVATSIATAEQATSYGIPLVTLPELDRIDLTIDGADEFDPQKRLIKGGGGALFREKLVAYASDAMIVITDASKQVEKLGQFPLPVEVLPMGERVVTQALSKLNCAPVLRLTAAGEPYHTDNGNLIFDCHLQQIDDPATLDRQLQAIPGIVETGLFLNLATKIIIGRDQGVEEIA